MILMFWGKRSIALVLDHKKSSSEWALKSKWAVYNIESNNINNLSWNTLNLKQSRLNFYY